MSRPPHQILGVARGAPVDEVKKAYRRLARALHPDLNPSPDAEARFKELGAAYEALLQGEATPARTGGVPDAFWDDFADALDRAEALVLRGWLARHLDAATPGAVVATRMAHEWIDGALRVGGASRGGRRARRWARRVEIVDDPRGDLGWLMRVTRLDARRWRITVFPRAFWRAGHREAGDLDDAVAMQLASQVLTILMIEARFHLPDGTREGQLAEAAAVDAAALARWRARVALWTAVAALSFAMLYAGFTAR